MPPRDDSVRARPRELGWLAGLAGLLLAVALGTEPPADRPALHQGQLEDALRRGVDRLIRLQGPDGSWGGGASEPGQLSRSGRPALALLEAAVELGEPAPLAAAGRTAEALHRELPTNPGLVVSENLRFLVEHGRLLDRPEDGRLAASAWSSLRDAEGKAPDHVLAWRFLARPGPADLELPGWRNYLLWRAGERVLAARALGEDEHAARFGREVFGSWSPKRSAPYWVLGTASGLEALDGLADADDSETLRRHHDRLLVEEELIAAIPWMDTPHDAHAATQQAALALRVQLREAPLGSQRHARVLEGLGRLIRAQARHGGWPAHFNLADGPLHHESVNWVPDEMLGVGETAEVDAEVVLTLIEARRYLRGEKRPRRP
ncbi:MAG: hypothetical protein AAF533_12650 [Acidobacteriota bacterium]